MEMKCSSGTGSRGGFRGSRREPPREDSLRVAITPCHKAHGSPTPQDSKRQAKAWLHSFRLQKYLAQSIYPVTLTFESFSSFGLNQKNYLSSPEAILPFPTPDFTTPLFGGERGGNAHFQSQDGKHKRWVFPPSTSARDHVRKCE